jgi:hypothetical protein
VGGLGLGVEFKKRLEDFLEYVEELETKLREARHHIKKNIGLFSPEELECMAMDGLIEYKDIPFDKRTEYVARHIKRRNKEGGEMPFGFKPLDQLFF